MLEFLALSLAIFLDSIQAASILGDSKVSAAWYAGWHAEQFPLSSVSWSKYSQLTYAFATTTPDVNVLFLADSDEEFLPKFVAAAHQNDVLASLSIGGWTGSRWYSSNIGSAANRTAFVNTVTKLVTKYNLDGLDFDWEYPNHQGVGCNVINSDDTANFLAFLQELRQTSIGKNLTLSAATSLKPWMDASGQPSKDVSAFSKVLDYIAIMNYDVWSNEFSPTAGPNAPLNDTCAPTADQTGSAVSSVQAWLNAGFPVNQIALGVPSYGHSFVVDPSAALQNSSKPANTTTLASYPPYNASKGHTGDSWDDDGGDDVCGVFQGPSGVYNFWGMIADGYLDVNGSVKKGIDYRFDECSQTPYVYNPKTQTMVSYDDMKSFTAKGQFIGSNGLKGFAIWEAAGDSNDLLLDSILAATASGLANPNPNPPSASKTTSAPSGSIALTHSLTNVILPLLLWIILGFGQL
ncbi:chitinase [Mycena floridula]|nr:chitinase [Mycena floridula]